jgi:hypothetical protein
MDALIFAVFSPLMFRKRKITWIVLVSSVILIKIFSLFPGAVERCYSTGLYPVIARLQRLLFGWIPFSIGDLFYAVTAVWLLYSLFFLIRNLALRQAGKEYLLSVGRRIVFYLLLLYVVFNISWGLNYDRKGIADQLQLQVQPYSTAELSDMVKLMVIRLNDLDSLAHADRAALASHRHLFEGAIASYKDLSARDPRFAYPLPSVKSSIFSIIGSYLGFSGYYNPFSGEAQLNITVPLFSQPYTTCHEIGHQLGYAKENEANFAGFLSARSSADPSFRYSVYFELYLYAARELYERDSSQLKPLKEQLHPSIRKDFRELQAFMIKYRNPLEPVIGRLYGRYLKANRQPQGMHTYNEVVAWLIAYYKKNGAAAI